MDSHLTAPLTLARERLASLPRSSLLRKNVVWDKTDGYKIALGSCIGTVLGTAYGNAGLGVTLGVAVGVTVAALLRRDR